MINPDDLAKTDSEHGHQKALFAWSAMPDTQQRYPDLKWMFAVPNGGWRDKITANKLRAEGVKKGVPDIWLPIKRGKWAGLVIELKKPAVEGNRKGQIQKHQKDWIAFLKEQSYGAIVCYGWHEARQTIIQYLDFK